LDRGIELALRFAFSEMFVQQIMEKFRRHRPSAFRVQGRSHLLQKRYMCEHGLSKQLLALLNVASGNFSALLRDLRVAMLQRAEIPTGRKRPQSGANHPPRVSGLARAGAAPRGRRGPPESQAGRACLRPAREAASDSAAAGYGDGPARPRLSHQAAFRARC